ncbi:MAG: 4Fe-4S dicluster domain-containing protein [Humidesulfovibrio sp.]|nr:4Fe-4S dicluster domain-containing protein [Humidesulfovibrio sp.]
MQTAVRSLDLAAARDPAFQADVERESGQTLASCYQCGNCTAGCAYTPDYDFPVHQVMRLVQLGLRQQALTCRSIWLCATCQACTTRCPNNIDVAKVMDVLRHMARRAGHAPEANVRTFTDSFLSSVAKHGRVFEAGLAAVFAIKSGRPMQDAGLGLPMLTRGKLAFMPHEPEGNGKAEVAAIFARFAVQGVGPGSHGETQRRDTDGEDNK